MTVQTQTHAQVAVIGGGIIGGAIAYYAAKAGLDVVVLEKGELASGNSSRCEGNILAIDKDPGFDSQMSLKSQMLVDELSRELGAEAFTSEYCIQIASLLQQHGPLSPKSLRQMGAGDKTLSILAKNYYGWFEKIKQ